MTDCSSTRSLKRTHVDAFVSRFLSGIANTVRDTNPSISDNVSESGKKMCRNNGKTPISSAQAIRDARASLGKANDVYLQFNVMVLWGGDDADEHDLYPASASLTDEDVGERALRGMLVNQAEILEAAKQRLQTASSHLAYYVAVPEVRSWIRQTLVGSPSDTIQKSELPKLLEKLDRAEYGDTKWETMPTQGAELRVYLISTHLVQENISSDKNVASA